MNEKLLIRLISSPTNVNYLNEYIKSKFKIQDFKYICSEFPILLGDNYGYLDVFGVGRVGNEFNLYFFEAKLDRPGMKEVAENECVDYKDALSRIGLFPTDLIRLYQEAIIGENRVKPSSGWNVLPLILSESLISEICGVGLEELCDNYRRFTADYLSGNGVNITSQINSNLQLLPVYPITKRINGQWNGLLYCYNYDGEREAVETGIETSTKDYSLNLNNQEVYNLFRGLDRNLDFTIQLYLNGHSRPNFFLQYDKDLFICLENIGKGAFRYMGVFNKRVACDIDNSLIFSTVPVEMGIYRVIDSGRQRIELDLQGAKHNIRLNLSFGRVISFSSKITGSKGVQKTLSET